MEHGAVYKQDKDVEPIANDEELGDVLTRVLKYLAENHQDGIAGTYERRSDDGEIIAVYHIGIHNAEICGHEGSITGETLQ